MLATPENTPLTYVAQALVKVASRRRKLSNNSAEWGRQIQDALYNEQQELNDKKINIHWESKDDTTGNGVGRIVIEGKIAIPVIVENFKLAPLDTYTDTNTKPHRLSPKRMKKALFNPDLFNGIISPQDERGLMPDIPLYRSYGVLPWEEGRRTYASLLDEVLPYATHAELEKFAGALQSDPQIAVNFHAYGNTDFVSKVLNTRPAGMAKIADDLAEGLPVSVVQLRMLPDQSLMMKMASDGVYAPQEVVLARKEFAKKAEALGIADLGEALQKASSRRGLTVTLRPRNASPIFAPEPGDNEAISKFGSYVVKDVMGKDHHGYVFPWFYQLDKSATPQSLFVGEQLSVMQAKIAGVLDPHASAAEIPSTIPEQGDTGIFVFEAADGEGGFKAAALEPVEIVMLEKGAGSGITGRTLMGQEVLFTLSQNATDLVEVPNQKIATYLLPHTAKFVKISNLIADSMLVGEPGTLRDMVGAEVLGDGYCKIASPLDGRMFQLYGPPAESMGSGATDQYPDETVFKLACMGLSAESAEAVMDKAAEVGSVVVGGLRHIKPGIEMLGHDKRAEKMQILATLPSIQLDPVMLLKIASDVQDPTSVDRVLALNFLNPQTIGVLVDHMNDLEDTGTRLSEMLLAARLGAKSDLNEGAIVQARQAIDDVLEGLENLKSRLGPQTQTDDLGGSVE